MSNDLVTIWHKKQAIFISKVVATQHGIVEGETIERGPFTLKSDDVPFNLTGYTVELVIRPFRGTDYSDTDGEVRVVADTSGALGRMFVQHQQDTERRFEQLSLLLRQICANTAPTRGDREVCFQERGQR